MRRSLFFKAGQKYKIKTHLCRLAALSGRSGKKRVAGHTF